MKKLLLCLIMIFSSQTVFAQTLGKGSGQVPEGVILAEEIRRKNNEVGGRDDKGMMTQPNQRAVYNAEIIEKAKKAEAEKLEAIKEINKKFSPPAEYYVKYAGFLKQKNTGLARMFPDKNCGGGKTVDVKELERCSDMPEIKGGGSLYSFRLSAIPSYMPLQIILSFIEQSDMHFVGDHLIVGNSYIQDIISEIGDMDIERTNSGNEAVKFLSNLKPDKDKTKFESRRKSLETGINSGGYFYSTSAAVKLNKTYALRSIAYERYDANRKSLINTDILAVFKIVNQERDGSIIMLWKLLKQKNAPLLENK